MLQRTLQTIALAALIAGAAPPVCAQGGLLKKIKDNAKEKATERVDQRTDQALDTAVNKAEHAITCVVTDRQCLQRAQAAGQPVQVTDSRGRPVSSADSAAALQSARATASADAAGAGSSSAAPGTGVWLNYDFIPGDRTLFYDDFSDDQTGNLPSHEDGTSGNATVAELDGHKYFRTTTGATFTITLSAPLPQRFTIEATYCNPNNGHPLDFQIGDDQAGHVWCGQDEAGINGDGPNGQKEASEAAKGIGPADFVNCRFMFDGGYVKAYLNEQRLAQLNGLVFSRGRTITVTVPEGDEGAGGTLLASIWVAEGGKKLYDALATSGRVATHGILFATGSAEIRGESTPTLKEIGEMLTAHPELKLLIEGHTDNVGSAAANQTLSEQRATAVKQYLIAHFQIDPSRLSTKGYGASRPVASNDTADGRQQNRRVELVRM
jgi:OOP family OmpA-OmpF porin